VNETPAPRKPRPLGLNQRLVLRALSGHYRSGSSERPWPGHGWTLDTRSRTISVLVSLEARGLVERGDAYGRRPLDLSVDAATWYLTEAGREMAKLVVV
jgi:hypothetical protein